jgi:hypothetical protein
MLMSSPIAIRPLSVQDYHQMMEVGIDDRSPGISGLRDLN